MLNNFASRTPSEQAIGQALVDEGWDVIGTGWPDFLCFRDDAAGSKKVICVEAKQGKDRLREDQRLVHAILSGVGLPVYLLRSPDVSQLDQRASLDCYSRENVDTLTQQAERLEKTLKIFCENLILQREATMRDYDERFAKYTVRAQNMLTRFRELEDLMKAARKKFSGLHTISPLTPLASEESAGDEEATA